MLPDYCYRCPTLVMNQHDSGLLKTSASPPPTPKSFVLTLSHFLQGKWNFPLPLFDHFILESSWNVMAHGDAREGKWRGNWRREWVASTLHTTSELSVSSITTADAHTSPASSRLNWRLRRFKWTCPFRRKTKSVFCACAITFQTQSTAIEAAVAVTTLLLTISLFSDQYFCSNVTYIALWGESVHYGQAWFRAMSVQFFVCVRNWI